MERETADEDEGESYDFFSKSWAEHMSLYGEVCEPCPLQVRVQDGYNLNKKRPLYLLFSHACDQPVGIGGAREIRRALGHFSTFPSSHHFSHFPYSETCSCNISLSSWGYHRNCSEIAVERCIQNETPPPSVLNVHCHDIWAQFSQVRFFFFRIFFRIFLCFFDILYCSKLI